jgi:hypothetical protein
MAKPQNSITDPGWLGDAIWQLACLAAFGVALYVGGLCGFLPESLRLHSGRDNGERIFVILVLDFVIPSSF